MSLATADVPQRTGAGPGQPWARFDDCRAGRSLVFDTPLEWHAAYTHAEVPGLLDHVEVACRDGHWAYGFVAYEAATAFDGLLRTHAREPGSTPLAWFGIAAEPRVTSDLLSEPVHDARPTLPTWEPEWTPAEYTRALEAVRSRIAAGETYEANLTTRLYATTTASAMPALYRHMLTRQGPGHAVYLDIGSHVIASASPELFFRRRGSTLLTRPMKGTARRRRTPRADVRACDALRASVKERAENVIVVDLVRNDLARVAEVGSVRVEQLCTVEAYGNVWQMTSDVRATVPEAIGLHGVFGALFPCGSITGAPKVRTMQIIHELESGPRGTYCGAIGWVAPPTAALHASFNVAIRTAVMDRATGTARYGVGSGITWDSAAAAEAAELDAKAAILRRGRRPWTSGPDAVRKVRPEGPAPLAGNVLHRR